MLKPKWMNSSLKWKTNPLMGLLNVAVLQLTLHLKETMGNRNINALVRFKPTHAVSWRGKFDMQNI